MKPNHPNFYFSTGCPLKELHVEGHTIHNHIKKELANTERY
jgi:hypothetical protein